MQVQNFERKIILRVSRTLLLIIAGLTILSLLGAVLYFVYGVFPAIREPEPRKPNPPKPATLTIEEVKARLEKQPLNEKTKTVQPTSSPAFVLPIVDTWLAELEPLFAQIKTFFPGEGAPWQDRSETYCALYHPYFTSKCINWKKKTILGLRSNIISTITPWGRDVRKQYLESVIIFLAQTNESNRKDILESFVVTDSEGAALAMLGQTLAEVFKLVTGNDQLIYTYDIAKIFPAKEPEASDYVRGMRVSLEILPLMPETVRHISLFQMTPFFAVDENSIDVSKNIAENLITILEKIEKVNRFEAVHVFANVFSEKMSSAMQNFRIAMSERQVKIEEQNLKYENSKAKKMGARYQGMIGVGSALGSLAILGWFLALLAIERNTRTLTQILKNDSSLKE